MRPWLVLAVLGLAVTATEAQAQYLQGVVTYNYGDLPVAAATVRLVDADGRVVGSALSTLDGVFAISVPAPGDYWVHVEHLTAFSMVDGPVTVEADRNTFVVFQLVPQPFAMEELTVQVPGRSRLLTRSGFYERERTSSGFFMDDLAIARRGPIRSTDLVRGVPGVSVMDARVAGGGSFPLMDSANRFRGTATFPRPCFPRVYVDGVIMEVGGMTQPGGGFDEIVRAHDIMGIEVYRSPAEIPPQFGGLTDCGVILIWTGGRRR